MSVVPISDFVINSKKFPLQDLLDTVNFFAASGVATDATQVIPDEQIGWSTKNRTFGALVHTTLSAMRGTTTLPIDAVVASSTIFNAPMKRFHIRTVLKTVSTLAVMLPTKPLYFIADWGDSRAAAGYLDNNERNRGALSPLNWAQDMSNAGYLIGPNFGKSGDRSDQALARVDAIIASGVGTVRVVIGLNNFAQADATYTYVHAVTGVTVTESTVVAQTLADLKNAVDRIVAAGSQVLIEIDLGANNLNVRQAAKVREYNNLVVAYVNSKQNVYYNDARFITQVDIDAAQPQFKQFYSEDGTHLNGRGSYYASKPLKTRLSQIIPSYFFTFPARSAVTLPANGRTQLANNPLFANGSGGTAGLLSIAGTTTTTGSTTVNVTSANGLIIGATVTGAGIPANTTVVSGPANGGAGDYVLSNAATASASVTLSEVVVNPGSVIPANCVVSCLVRCSTAVSVIADASGIGNNVVIKPVFRSVNDGVRFTSDISIANWQAGDIVEATLEIAIVGSANVKSASLEMNYSALDAGGAQIGTPSFDMAGGSTTVGPDEDFAIIQRTKTFQISNAMATKQFLTFGVRMLAARAAAADATTITIKSMIMNRVAALPY